jgi:ribosomal protein S18 acetylase RimI-like enzyme
MSTSAREIEIRPASMLDAEALVALDHALLADGRGVVMAVDQLRNVEQMRVQIDDGYRQMSNGSSSIWLVAVMAGELVGAATLKQLEPALCSHVGLLSLGVHPSAQRRGIGRALLRALIEHAQSFGMERLELWVRADNARARALYESEGFSLESVRRRFIKLESGSYVDDLVMTRFLT